MRIDKVTLSAAHCGRCQEILLFPGVAPASHRCGLDAIGPTVVIASVDAGTIPEGTPDIKSSEPLMFATGAVRCPECLKAGKRSRVTVGASSSTLLGALHPPFYDKEGCYHSHDPNVTTTQYTCSEGHKWNNLTRSKCWCEKNAPSPPPEEGRP